MAYCGISLPGSGVTNVARDVLCKLIVLVEFFVTMVTNLLRKFIKQISSFASETHIEQMSTSLFSGVVHCGHWFEEYGLVSHIITVVSLLLPLSLDAVAPISLPLGEMPNLSSS